MTDTAYLRRIKIAHTLIWAFLAGSIVALPFFGWTGHFGLSLAVTLLIAGECLVLALNRGRCPLTSVAAQYTGDRADNFDIYLPLSIARHNKTIFGVLFVLGEIVVATRWFAFR
jgi:hypothetical protein